MNRDGKRCVLFHAVLVPILLLAASAAVGGVNRWTASGPEGGSITALAVSPASPRVLYAGTSEGGVFKSEDRAATWSATARFPEGQQTRTLAIDPTTPATLYVGTEAGVLKTTDGGATWKALSFPVSSVSTLTIDPKKPSTLYAAVFDSVTPVFKSEDAGQTWFAASDGLPTHSAPTLAMDPSNPSSLYFAAGGGGSGVFASTDGGGHWKPYSSSLRDVFVVAIDPSPPGTVYAGTLNGLFKSVGGAAWQSAGLSAESGFNRVYSIAVSPFAPGHLYVAAANGAYKSEDRAETWSPIEGGFPLTPQPGNSPIPSSSTLPLVFDPSDPSTVYAATGAGVFKSASGGEAWARSTSGIHGAFIESVAVLPGACGPFAAETIYAGMGANGLARSGDGGRSWTNLDLNATPVGVTSVLSLPSDPRTVIAGTWADGIYQSRDAGANWEKISQTLDQVLSLAADPSGSRLFSGGADQDGWGQVARSEDGGKTWKVTLSGVSLFDFDYPAPVQALGVAPSNPQVVYAAADQVFRSLDGGKTWASIGPLPSYTVPAGFARPAYASVLAVDPLSASTLYIATGEVGLIKSNDGGKTFRQLGNGLPVSAVGSVVIDPTVSSTLYAAAGGGLFRSLDGGETWAPFDRGLEGQSVHSLAIDRSGRRLFAGASGGGLFHYEIAAGPFDLSIGPDGSATLLADTGAGAALLPSLDRLGTVSRNGPYGPYEGWTAQAMAAGADGLTRLLWNNEDGSAALWLLAAGRNRASYRLDPMLGWTAIDVAAGVAGSTDILRIREDGALAIFRVDNSGQVAAGPTYGPYEGWSATAIAGGPDGLTRVLWNNVDGSAAISLMQSGNLLAASRYGPVTGWTAVDLAVGADGQTRLIWTHADGRTALWRVDEAGNPTAFGPIYDPPAGFTATRVSAGADGLTRVLWTSKEGSSKVWLMSADNVLLQSFDIGPN